MKTKEIYLNTRASAPPRYYSPRIYFAHERVTEQEYWRQKGIIDKLTNKMGVAIRPLPWR